MKIRSMGAALFHADEQTGRQADRQTDRWRDMMKVIVVFRNFANAPKNDLQIIKWYKHRRMCRMQRSERTSMLHCT